MSPAELLEIPEIRAQFSAVSVEEFHLLPERNERGRRTELIEGVVIEKMPKSPLHSRLGKHIYDRWLLKLPKGWTIRQDQPLSLRTSEPEPDIAVIRADDAEFDDRHPTTATLVVEVAITTLSLDREKARIYAEAGVEEYWIIIPKENCTLVYRSPEGNRYVQSETVTGEKVLECAMLPELTLTLNELA